VARDEHPRREPFDDVEGLEPSQSRFIVGLLHPQVNTVVGNVASDDRVKIGNVYDRRRVGVALPDIDEAWPCVT
jgi:hypothetical protein